MSRVTRLPALCVFALAASRCTTPEPPPPPPLVVTASETSLVADGAATLLITLSGAEGQPVRLTATQGTWVDSGATTLRVSGNAAAVLRTCDSRTVAGCGGNMKVTAVADNGAAGAVMVEFVSLENCGNGRDDDADGDADCADADCLGGSCALPVGAVGTGVCTEAGTCVCDTGLVETCDDGLDNNCNAKSDCAETSCAGNTCAMPNGATGVCNKGVCTCPSAVEVCSNAIDDDCDGLVDCADNQCQATATALGKVCDVDRGLTCGSASGGGACDVCPGAEALAEQSCGDGKDNDCDLKVDCADEHCDARACGANGMACAAGACACSGNGAAPEAAEATCGDGLDNDCDGKADCLDPDCAALSCGANGRTCAGGACACTGNGGAAQAAETTCNDGADNDCDGVKDCEEAFCQGVGGAIGKICDAQGHACTTPVAGVSACTACSGNGGVAQAAETYCADGKDNDCDGLPDCQDADCDQAFCTATGKMCTLATASCDCPGQSPETTCNDARDNDCDGYADCKDLDCHPFAGNPGKACGPNGFVCAGTGVNGTGTCGCSGNGGLAQTAEAACNDGFDNDCDGYADCLDVQCRPSTPGGAGKDCSQPNGTPPTVGMQCSAIGQCICPAGQSNEVTCGDGVDNDCDGVFDCADSDCAGLSCAAFGKTCSAGACTCAAGTTESCSDLVDNDCDGLADCADTGCAIGAQCNTASTNYQCQTQGTARVCLDTTSTVSLQLVASPARIPANGLSTSTITATLKDGTVAQGGKTVTFALGTGSAGGVSPASAITNIAGQTTAVYTSDAADAGTQIVTAQYNTGTQVISGSVAIDTPAVGQVKYVSQQHSIMGVKYSSYQETNEITFQVLDNNGLPYPAGLSVSFTHAPVGGSYIGSAPSCTSTQCTASTVTAANGIAKVTLRSGTVASVVSVTATASAGGSSAYTTASNIAIVGARASGSNISINCTPKNVPALTDEDCTNSLVTATVSCTATFGDRFQNVLGVVTQATFSSEAGLAGPPQFTDKFGIAKGTVAVGGAKLPVDVTALSGEYSLTYDSGCGSRTHNPRDGLVTIIVSTTGEEGFVDGSNGQAANGTYDPGEYYIDIGEPFVDANDNGTRDSSEPYLDSNNNAQWDGPNGSWDSNKVIWAETRVVYSGLAEIAYDVSTGDYTHSRWYEAPFAIAPAPLLNPGFSVLSNASGGPTTDSVDVYFTDRNFNLLNAATTFQVQAVSGGITAKYTQAPTAPDNLGMSFTQQYCNTSGGACSNTCQHAPCHVVTRVTGFSYGNYGTVEIKAGSQPATSAEARVSATFKGIVAPMSVSGDSL